MQKRKNWIYIFVLFLTLSILIFFLFKLPIFQPVSSFVQNIFSPVQSLTHNIFLGFGQNKEINDLKKQNLELTRKIVDQGKITSDNKALRDQFSIQYPKTQQLLEARVISSPSFIPGVNLPETLVIDKGEKDQVKKGMAVVYKDNLIGKIQEVSGNASKIILVTNSNFSVISETFQTKAQGVVKGQGGGELILDNVILSQALKQDDLVLTKGEGDLERGIMPSLVIGKILSVNKNPSDLFQVAKVKSLLDFSNLSTVFVVKGL
ncbi:MAG: rod shape-determining protein MreC [Candidatus Levybacteria bacterium]|nr:rod shape-determining protein MreC [Candidatus Levybacteria bacterium]